MTKLQMMKRLHREMNKWREAIKFHSLIVHESIFSNALIIIHAETGEEMSRAKEHMRYCKEQREFELDTLPDSQAAPRTSSRRINDRRNCLYLDTDQTHTVWKPKHSKKKETTGFTVMEVIKNRRTLLDRQQKLLSRVEATRKVLKAQKEELATLEEDSNSDNEENSEAQQPTQKDGKRWKNAIARVKKDNRTANKKAKRAAKRCIRFHDTVSKYVSDMSTSSPNHGAQLPTGPTEAEGAALYSRKRAAPVRAATMSLLQWKSQVFEDQREENGTPNPIRKEKNRQCSTILNSEIN